METFDPPTIDKIGFFGLLIILLRFEISFLTSKPKYFSLINFETPEVVTSALWALAKASKTKTSNNSAIFLQKTLIHKLAFIRPMYEHFL